MRRSVILAPKSRVLPENSVSENLIKSLCLHHESDAWQSLQTQNLLSRKELEVFETKYKQICKLYFPCGFWVFGNADFAARLTRHFFCFGDHHFLRVVPWRMGGKERAEYVGQKGTCGPHKKLNKLVVSVILICANWGESTIKMEKNTILVVDCVGWKKNWLLPYLHWPIQSSNSGHPLFFWKRNEINFIHWNFKLFIQFLLIDKTEKH